MHDTNNDARRSQREQYDRESDNTVNAEAIQLMRHATSADEGLTETEFARGLAALERGIDASTRTAKIESRARRSSRARKRGALWVGGGVIAIGALVGTVIVVAPSPVLTPVLGPTVNNDTHAAAVELLERAAKQVVFEDAAPGPGHILRSESYSTGLVVPYQEVETDADGNRPEQVPLEPSAVAFGTETIHVAFDTGDPNNSPSATLVDSLVELYGDPDTLVRTWGNSEPTETASSFVNSSVGPFGLWQPIVPYMLGTGSRDNIDDSYVDENGQVIVTPHFAPERAALLPREPDALRAHAIEVIRAAGVTDEQAQQEALFEWLVPLITFDKTPADLRAAAYAVLSTMEGVEVSATEVELGGQVGTGITHETDAGVRTELVLNPETGLPVGERVVLTKHNELIPTVPAGTVISSYAVKRSSVDSIPCFTDEMKRLGLDEENIDFGGEQPPPYC